MTYKTVPPFAAMRTSLWGTVAVALLVAEPLALAQTMPQAPVATRAAFLSASSDQWDVAIDGHPACATPCSLELSSYQFATLRSQERDPVILEVGRLPPGDLVVTGKPLEHGSYAGGIVATSLGGMAAVVGITLTAIGAAKDRPGMTTAGLISGAAGAVAVAGGIYLMVSALPSVIVGGAAPRIAGATATLAARF